MGQYARIRRLLFQIRILRECSGAELIELGRSAQVLRYDAGETIADQADAPTAVSLLAFGRVRPRIITENGRELVVGEIEAGDFFGEEALTRASTRRATIVAMNEATVVSVPAESFASFLRTHPRVAYEFALQVTRRLGVACESAAWLGLLSVEERLLRTLVRLGGVDGEERRDGVLLRRCPTHVELAAHVGACRETVTRAFQSLKRRGLLVQQGSGCLVRHPASGGEAD
ncbi:MAG TPA: Crp/Fnr family transcriptional regulator [Polyangia bacterium]